MSRLPMVPVLTWLMALSAASAGPCTASLPSITLPPNLPNATYAEKVQAELRAFSDWVSALRQPACKADLQARNWSAADVPYAGANSCGQPCKIGWENQAIGYADGLLVQTALEGPTECWAFLNEAHTPADYIACSTQSGVELDKNCSTRSLSSPQCSLKTVPSFPRISGNTIDISLMGGWVDRLRACKAEMLTLGWSTTDLAPYTGGNSNGQGCKIQWSSPGSGYSDGQVVQKSLGGPKECWAYLNEAHKPLDYWACSTQMSPLMDEYCSYKSPSLGSNSSGTSTTATSTTATPHAKISSAVTRGPGALLLAAPAAALVRAAM